MSDDHDDDVEQQILDALARISEENELSKDLFGEVSVDVFLHMAQSLRVLFSTLQMAGFTENQALYLASSYLTAVTRAGLER